MFPHALDEGTSTSNNVNFAQELINDEEPSHHRTFYIPQKDFQEEVSHSIIKSGVRKYRKLRPHG